MGSVAQICGFFLRRVESSAALLLPIESLNELTFVARFATHMQARRKTEQTGDLSFLPRGWCLGSEQFRQELLLQMTTVQGSKFAGPEWKQTGQKKAELILAEEMQGRGWNAQNLQQLRK